MTNEVQLRRGLPEELAVMREIDDESGPMYLAAGIDLGRFSPTHPFVQSESARWLASAEAGRVHMAVHDGHVVGFAVMGTLDGLPYLDQLSMRAGFMRRGIGTRLLEHALALSKGAGELWLTTYAHLAWNAPYYERAGFRVVGDAQCGPEIRAVLETQRAVMPFPEQRVAMVQRTR